MGVRRPHSDAAGLLDDEQSPRSIIRRSHRNGGIEARRHGRETDSDVARIDRGGRPRDGRHDDREETRYRDRHGRARAERNAGGEAHALMMSTETPGSKGERHMSLFG